MPRKEFLDLPAEIRNQIYRNLLVTQHVMRRFPNPSYLNSRTESEPIDNVLEPSTERVGTVRCQNIWKIESKFEMAILRVSRQVYKEAHGIFQNENQWVVLGSNKPGFSEAIRDHGFNVVYCGEVEHIKNPILIIAVIFPSLNLAEAINSCIMTTVDIDQLSRALWTAKGMEGMVLQLILPPGLSESPNMEDILIEPFCLVRGIRHAEVTGSPKFAERLPKAAREPFENGAEILAEMAQVCSVVQSYKEQDRWIEAAEACELTITFLADCYKVYGSNIIEDNDQVFAQIRLVAVKFALDLSEARSCLRQYKLGLKYAEYALRISPVPPPMFQICLLRGQAYTGLKQHTEAMRDLLDAQERKPQDSAMLKALGTLKQSLDPDPVKALSAFKDLRTAVEQSKAEKEIARFKDCNNRQT